MTQSELRARLILELYYLPRPDPGKLLDDAVNALPLREQEMIRDRYFQGLTDGLTTYRKLGREHGTSAERARQVIKNALSRMRAYLNEAEGELG